MWWKLLLLTVTVVACTATLASISYQQAKREAEIALDSIIVRAKPSPGTFDPAMVSHLPEIARRYFTHAIAVGAPLHTTARIEMEGTFLLGDSTSFQSYAMTARQVLSPPSELVWIPIMRSGAISISGSNALVQGTDGTDTFVSIEQYFDEAAHLAGSVGISCLAGIVGIHRQHRAIKRDGPQLRHETVRH